MAYSTFLECLLEDAGKLAMSFPRETPSRIKDADVNQVVTAADLAVGSLIKQHILKSFPCDSIIDEEFGAVRGTSPVTWVVDPIDGTSNFAVGSPLFGLMVGVLKDDKPVAGAVALPALRETYVAETGQGAYRNGSRLKIEADGEISQRLIAYGIDVYPSEIDLDCRILARIASCCSGVRMSNSIFDCMMVATGAYGAFAHRRNRIWDCVAPQVIIEEAGGTFSAVDGNILDYTCPFAKTADVFSILASVPGFHETLVHAIGQGGVP